MDVPRKYREIAADLQSKIESGELEPGEKLPSDAELSDNYKASRNTVRDAIEFLRTRRVVEKRSGRGTFVLRKIDPFSTVVTAETGFGGFEGAAYASEVSSKNRRPTVTTPKIEIQDAPPDIAALLAPGVGLPVVIRHQQRFIDGVLWSMQTTYYPKRFMEDGATRLLDTGDIPEGVRSYLETKLGIKEIGSRDTMMVRAPNPDEAKDFGIPDDGSIAVFETRQTGVEISGQPVRVTVSIYPADRNQFSMTTGALARPAAPRQDA